MATLNNMFARSMTLTERELERITRTEILPAYREAYKQINKQLRNTYLKVLAGVPKADYYNEMLKYGRYTSLLKEINKAYTTAARRAGIAQRNAGKLAIRNVFYLRQYIFNWTNPGLRSFITIPPELVDLAVIGQPEMFKEIKNNIINKYGDMTNYAPPYGTLSDVLLKNRADDLVRIKQTLTQSLIQGQSYTQTAAAIRKVLNTSAGNARRIARTEGNRLMNAGAFANSQAVKDAGINIVRVWDATLDDVTRSTHRHLDGKEEDENGMFQSGGFSAPYPGHFGSVKQNANCRCSTIDIIPGLEPEVRTGRNPNTGENEVMSYRDFDTWAKENGLTTNDYGAIL